MKTSMFIPKLTFVGMLLGMQILSARAAVPVVDWIRPTNGITLGTGTPILLRASASDSSGALSSIDFFAGTNLLRRLSGIFTNGTYGFIWSNAPVGTHQLHAEAENSAGERGASASVQIFVTDSPPPNLLPVVTLIQPTNGAVFSAGTPILLRANAMDPDGVLGGIDFFAGTNLLRHVSPSLNDDVYSFTWTNATPGMYFLRAEAVDNVGDRGVSASVQVPVTGVTNCSFSVSPLARSHGPGVSTGTVTVTTGTNCSWSANSTNAWITVLSSATNVGSGTVSYEVTSNTGPGRMGRIRIAGQNFTVTQAGITNVPPTNAVPVVNWVRPSNGSNFPAGSTIQLTVRATDADGTVTNVEFFATTATEPSTTVNLGRVFGPTTNNLYSLFWSNAPAGSFLLQAVADDNVVARGFSGIVRIFVNSTNVPPTNAVPVVNWVRPTNGSNFPAGSTIQLTVRATDADGTVTNVEFFATTATEPSTTVRLGRVFGPSTNNLYSLFWSNAPVGGFELQAVADDNVGGRGFSSTVLIFVNGGTNAPPTNNVLPVVNWLRPTNGAALEPFASTLLTVNATDADGTINFVEFYAGSNLLGRGTKVPTNSTYNLTWTNPPPGIFLLHAEAVDNANGRGISAPVQVMVGNIEPVDVGLVEVPAIGHQVSSNAVVDFLIDQDQSSGGGGLLQNVSADWDTNIQFKLTVAAPPNMKFLVTLPPGALARFGGFLWWESTRGGFSGGGQVIATFADLEGIEPPQFTPSANLSDSHGYFGFSGLESTAISNDFSFTAVTLTGTVALQYTGNGAEDYVPHLESSFFLFHPTTEANDPGGFIAIVPNGPMPMAVMVSPPGPSGVDIIVYGRPGRTHIVECSLDIVTWTAISKHVMPPKGSMTVKDASATTTDNRFYRIVEVP